MGWLTALLIAGAVLAFFAMSGTGQRRRSRVEEAARRVTERRVNPAAPVDGAPASVRKPDNEKSRENPGEGGAGGEGDGGG